MNGAVVPLTVSSVDRERMRVVSQLASKGAAGVTSLIHALNEPSWVVRRAVVAALAAAGDAAVAPLCEVLRTQRDHEGRISAAVDALVLSRGEPDAMVAKLAAENDPAVICDAAQVLGRRRAARSVPLLTRLAEHENENVAMAAIEALGRIGGTAAIDALIASARSGNFFRTFPAIDVLGRSGDPRVIPTLAELARDSLYAHEASRALGRTGHVAALEPLLGVLTRDGDTGVRIAAMAIVDLLHRVWERNGEAAWSERLFHEIPQRDVIVGRLAQAVRGADSAEQGALCRVLGLLGGEAASEVLLDLLSGPPNLTRAAAAALASTGPTTSPRLRHELRHGDSARRLVLLPIVSTDANAVAEIDACLEDPDPHVRALACDAFARLRLPATLERLFALLDDPEPRVTAAAVAAIQAIGGDEAQTRSLQAVRSADASVRRAALELLAHFAHPDALSLLVEASNETDERIRDVALQALVRFSDPRATDAMVRAASHPSDRTRGASMRALGAVADDPSIRVAIAKGATDSKPWVRYYACQALGKHAPGWSTQLLLDRTRDEAGQVRVAAIEALARIDDPRARAAVCIAADGEEVDMRRAALRGLGAARIESALPMLLQAVEADDALTRVVAAGSLARFDMPPAMQALARAACDVDERVRKAALDGLQSQVGEASSRALGTLLDEPSLRGTAVKLLAARPDGAAILAHAATEHPDAEVRQLATDNLNR